MIGNDRAESCREAIDLIGAFDNKGSYGGSCSNNGPKIIESSQLNLSWRGFQLTGPESNTNLNNVLIHSNVSAFSRYAPFLLILSLMKNLYADKEDETMIGTITSNHNSCQLRAH